MTNLIKWPIVKLETLAAKQRHAMVGGPFGSNLVSRDYTHTGVPVIRGGNITDSKYISHAGLVFVSESKADALRINSALPGDIVFTQRGTLGQVGIIPKNTEFAKYVISQSQMKMTVDPKKADINYLYYFFRMPSTISYIENHALQAGVPHINLAILKKFKVLLPRVGIQRKIAAILTAYDDLIEVNKRRIALLEKMAEELYREWFVRMRFPGHQNTRFVKGVPEGWEFCKIDDAFEFTGGGTPSKSVGSYWKDGSVNWFTPSDITSADGLFLSSSDVNCSEEGLSRSSARLFPAYSVMMTSRATIGAIGINTTPACTNQGFITCIPNERFTLPYLFQWLKLAKPYFEQLCGGATFPELTKGTFKKLEILVPSIGVIKQFTKLSSPLFKSIETGLEQNRNLTKTRDLLLPRLISGKLSVEDLDIQFPPSMRETVSETAANAEANNA